MVPLLNLVRLVVVVVVVEIGVEQLVQEIHHL